MILFTTLLTLPLMLLLGGLVDVAVLGQRDNRLQVCADACALAAASSTRWVEPVPPQTAGRWELDLGQVATYQHLNCPGATLDPPTASGQPPIVSVVLRTSSETSFLRVAGINQLPVAAHAKAVRRNVQEAERPEPGRSRLIQ